MGIRYGIDKFIVAFGIGINRPVDLNVCRNVSVDVVLRVVVVDPLAADIGGFFLGTLRETDIRTVAVVIDDRSGRAGGIAGRILFQR